MRYRSSQVFKNGDAELIFRNNDETLVRFKGQVTRRDPYAIKVKLTESDVSCESFKLHQ